MNKHQTVTRSAVPLTHTAHTLYIVTIGYNRHPGVTGQKRVCIPDESRIGMGASHEDMLGLVESKLRQTAPTIHKLGYFHKHPRRGKKR